MWSQPLCISATNCVRLAACCALPLFAPLSLVRCLCSLPPHRAGDELKFVQNKLKKAIQVPGPSHSVRLALPILLLQLTVCLMLACLSRTVMYCPSLSLVLVHNSSSSGHATVIAESESIFHYRMTVSCCPTLPHAVSRCHAVSLSHSVSRCLALSHAVVFFVLHCLVLSHAVSTYLALSQAVSCCLMPSGRMRGTRI